jgi:hypothetical protein
MSLFSDPGNAAFRDLPPGPHSGMPTDPDAHVAPDSFDRRLRTVLRSRGAAWAGIALVCVVVAIGILMSLD